MVSRMLPASSRILAFLDMGTNSVRISVVRINPNRSFSVLSQQREAVRLGDGEFLSEHLQPEAMDRAILVCRKFVDLAHSFHADEIHAVATSATREAQNRTEFLQRVREEAGVEMRVISGSEEARLIYLGVSSGIFLQEKSVLFLDIGGGSTEIIIGNQQQYDFLDSLKLGAIRLANLYLPDREAAVTPERYGLLQTYVRNASIRTVQRMKHLTPAYVVGSSGTAENLANVAALQFYNRPLSADDVLHYDQLREVIRRLCSLPLDERKKVPGLNPERADIIIAGAAVLDTLMEELSLTEMRVSTRGLRDGLLVDYLARQQGAHEADLSVRERSVLQLGRICAFDEEHARLTARLACELFDSAAAHAMHTFGDWERELLYYAALLHDLGSFLSYHNHQAHTYYFIQNADLLGFDQTEIAIMAATAYFHRKPFPRKRHPEFARLDLHEQEIVRILCVLLRLAESLDRSHTGVIGHAVFSRTPANDILLEVHADAECQLELWGAENHRETFKRVFGSPLKITLVIENHNVETAEHSSIEPVP